MQPVKNGPLARSMEPAKAALAVGARGVGEYAQTYGDMMRGDRGPVWQALSVNFFTSLIPMIAAPFMDDDSGRSQRRLRNFAKYANDWNQAKITVTDQIIRTQRRLDTLDRDLIALDKAIAGAEGTARSIGGNPSPSVTQATVTAKKKRSSAEASIQALRNSIAELNAKAEVVANGERDKQTGPGSDAQRALEAAAGMAAGIDAQVEPAARSLNAAVAAARAATNAVNRWVDQESAKAQAFQQQQAQAALVESVTQRLQTPPPGFTFDALGNLVMLPPESVPPLLTGPYDPLQTGVPGAPRPTFDGYCKTGMPCSVPTAPGPTAGQQGDCVGCRAAHRRDMELGIVYVMDPCLRQCDGSTRTGDHPQRDGVQVARDPYASIRPSWAPAASTPSSLVPGAWTRNLSDPRRTGLPGADLVYPPGYAGPRIQ